MNKLLLALFLCLSSLSFGQYDMNDAKDTTENEQKISPMEIREKIYVGGDFSLSFGNQLYLMFAPLAGYDIWGGISAGPTAMYQLQRINFTNGSSQSIHAYGGGIFARWRPPVFPYLLLHTEFDLYNIEDFSTPQNGDRTTIPAFYGGAGYAGGMGKAYYSIMLMYDFAFDLSNPNPLPRFFGQVPLYIRYGMVFYLG